MPWNGCANAGFTSGTPWLPLNDDWQTRNVEHQSKDPMSLLSLYQRLLALRRACPTLQIGGIAMIAGQGAVLSFERKLGDDRLFVALNLGGDFQSVALLDWAIAVEILLSTLGDGPATLRSEEHTSEIPLIMRTSSAVF